MLNQNTPYDDDVLKVFEGMPIPSCIHDNCRLCIANCRNKYNDFMGDEGTFYKDGFAVKCNFIPEDNQYINKKLKTHFTDDEWEELNALKSPLLWAMKNLKNPDNGQPWIPWELQKAPLACNSMRKVYRFGRRLGKTTLLAIEIMWFVFTNGGGLKDPETGEFRNNLKVLVLSPRKSHIDNLFKRIRDFLAFSPHLSACLHQNSRGAPQIISLKSHNNSINTITGFATGESSGGHALGARGQDADLIVMDESAWVGEDTIADVVKAILMTHQTTRLIMSSTPSGISGDNFERTCIKKPEYAEFYIPATERPDWDKIKDKMEKEFGASKEQWDREVLALFSQAGEGVFNKDIVRRAQEDYSYSDMKPYPGLIYTIGVDWNKEHGTEIVVTGTQKNLPHISWTVLTENIPKKDFNTPMGIDRIVQLNRIWNPAWIYVDEGGGGGTCSQLLKMYGKSALKAHQIDAKLAIIVKTYDFGSKIEITDVDGKKLKKPAKPFMVDNAVRKFELGEVKYSRNDLLLTNQLSNYIVTRRTNAGTPVYGLKEKKYGDHRLDALCLSLIAVRLEMPSLHNDPQTVFQAGVGFIPYNKPDTNSAPVLIGSVSRRNDSIYNEPATSSRKANIPRQSGRIARVHRRRPLGRSWR